ncbi:Malate dehydrogenase, cytoplasmic [Kappamyces sp. JEL0829]|nr:Malate dehydrogenase, cytoplasmic [Kappamyces sp. JEL0829]
MRANRAVRRQVIHKPKEEARLLRLVEKGSVDKLHEATLPLIEAEEKPEAEVEMQELDKPLNRSEKEMLFRNRNQYNKKARAKSVARKGMQTKSRKPLSLLMKLNPLVTKLSLYDIVNTPGVAADLSHINTNSSVAGYKGNDLEKALSGADVVIIPAGVPRKPGMTRDDLFNTNAGIVANLAEAAAKACPKANFLIISNPVNSTVPIFAEVLKKHSVFNPKRLFGVTTLDVVRASTFVSSVKGKHPKDVNVHVTGLAFTKEETDALTKRIQFGGDEVVKAKDGTGSATLSMAQAGARFADSLLKAMNGAKGIVEPSYVVSPVAAKDGIEYFSTNVELGPEGVAKVHPLGPVNAFEQGLYDAAVPELKSNIKKGVEFVKNLKA